MEPAELEVWKAAVLRFRREKDDFFKRSPHSPLEPADRSRFRGLSYFEPDVRYALWVVPEAVEGDPIEIPTSTGDVRSYVPVARLPFVVDGARVALTAYQQGDAWFVPFRDATSGKETYGAGRYLEVHPASEGEPVLVDFNAAYNPFCAYSEAYSCPFPPPDNWLRVPIRAGERTFDAPV